MMLFRNKLKITFKLMMFSVLILSLLQVFLDSNSDYKEVPRQQVVHEVGEWVANHKYFEYDFSKEERDIHQTCYIQQNQPFDPSLLKHVKKLPPLKCDTQIQITHIDDNGFLKFDEEGPKKSGWKKDQLRCMYSEILRNYRNKKDTFKYNNPIRFTGLANVKHTDFIRVICRNFQGLEVYYNFHLHIRDLPNESFKMDDIKYNVLVFGIDSLSRMQAMRQIPKTYTYLKEDLKTYIMRGYNKVGLNTFPNLGSFLTGSNPYSDPPLFAPICPAMKDVPKETNQDYFNKWKVRWDKCVRWGREYFEGDPESYFKIKYILYYDVSSRLIRTDLV